LIIPWKWNSVNLENPLWMFAKPSMMRNGTLPSETFGVPQVSNPLNERQHYAERAAKPCRARKTPRQIFPQYQWLLQASSGLLPPTSSLQTNSRGIQFQQSVVFGNALRPAHRPDRFLA
jgi:hypothetical protein